MRTWSVFKIQSQLLIKEVIQTAFSPRYKQCSTRKLATWRKMLQYNNREITYFYYNNRELTDVYFRLYGNGKALVYFRRYAKEILRISFAIATKINTRRKGFHHHSNKHKQPYEACVILRLLFRIYLLRNVVQNLLSTHFFKRENVHVICYSFLLQ